MAAEDPRDPALIGGLELVVELLLDALADLLAERLGLETRRHPLHQPQDHAEVLHVGPHSGRDAGVLHLDRHAATVVEVGLVDLADRRRGDRHRVEALEDVLDLLAVLALDHLLHVLEGHLGRRVAQLGQLGLEVFAELLGHQADVEKRHHLAELHRGALHRPQHGDDLLGRLDLPAVQRSLRLVLGAREVRGTRAELPDRLAGREAADARRPRDARGRDLVVVGH